MTRLPRQAFVVSHTHWDREWYRTFHQFRAALLDVVGQVLERLESDDAFLHFLLDGQTIILEDYLEIHPDQRDRIRRHVELGALAIGPWYILPDEFLVSAEATVRNLMIGHEVAAGIGPVQRVGYLPDSFGHIAQMPQILRRAGIDSFIYTRGNGDELETLGHEFVWRAPDGTEVLAINQCGGYCNAGALGLESDCYAGTQREVDVQRAVSQVRGLFAKMAPLSRGDVYLVSNGCDHYPPQPQFGRILDALRAAFPSTEFRHASLAEYVDAVRAGGFATHRYSGEFVWGRYHFILPGVWSARMYLKQLNDRAQTLLADYAEPLSAYAHFIHGEPYRSGQIGYAWKQLLRNHPHDSICGCSIDEVHRDMVPRFAASIETAEETVRRSLLRFAPTVGTSAATDRETIVTVANPLPARRSAVVERLLVFSPTGVDTDRLRIVNAAGRAVPHVVVRRVYVERFWGADYRTEPFWRRQQQQFRICLEQLGSRVSRGGDEHASRDAFVTVQFLAEDLPALGHSVYRVTMGDEVDEAPRSGSVTVAGGTMENDLCLVRLRGDGTFDLLDKETGNSYEGLNALSDVEDVGDEYDYAPAPSSRTVTSRGTAGTVRILEQTGLCGRLEAEFDFPIPRSIAADRSRRSDELATCHVAVRLALQHQSPIVDVEVVFDNCARDHRLRAEFPASVDTDTVISDGHFYVNHRPVAQPAGQDWVQPPAGTYPQQEFSLLEDGHRGLAILNRGLPEIAPFRDDAGRAGLALTLLRSVGWLSRDDFETRRRRNAGPMLATPDAQCPGIQRFHYAVVPFAGDYLSAGIKALSRSYRTPVVAIQGVAEGHVPGGSGLLEQASGATCISAIKQHGVRDTLVVRLYNVTSDPVTETLTFGRPLTSAWEVSLLEERMATLSCVGRALTLELGAHRIMTVEVEFE